MLLKSLKLTNILSFGPATQAVELRPLNVLIGPNGSGKSNFLEAIGLLRAAPRELAAPVREGGGVSEWIWKGQRRGAPEGPARGASYSNGSGFGSGSGYGDDSGVAEGTAHGNSRGATVEVLLSFNQRKSSSKASNLRHTLSFTEVGQRFEIFDERIENEKPVHGMKKPFLYFGYERGRPMLNANVPGKRPLKRETLHPEKSILAQFKDPERYPELASISDAYEDIALYREWSFGRGSLPRMPQKADLPTDHLLEDARNLGLILNRYRLEPLTKQSLIDAMRQVFDGIVDFSIKIEGGTVQIFLEEESGWSTPATRLSDGTVRWFSMLAVLLDPKPPRLVCIEEPELGLHPDLVPTLARLLKEASERMQLIVTTHSEVLINTLSDSPEDILVCDREGGSTMMRRLDSGQLSEWLKTYRLGQLWSKGVLGGNRW
ncbi:AAA family ATPase [Stigmatella sp. ncwal1]|uniref:AAA family ATPase n=1 Tax=Stigmatella ashevillensis TaxID=2995309 RepID=A0ABT5DF69_9BACT|nr:AAA family ATPase [Stigmatella ashevillena]MDC0711729.1 AAA family ATPase [Stigmatella ashevillena]